MPFGRSRWVCRIFISATTSCNMWKQFFMEDLGLWWIMAQNNAYLVCVRLVLFEVSSCPIRQLSSVFFIRYSFQSSKYISVQLDNLASEHKLKRQIGLRVLHVLINFLTILQLPQSKKISPSNYFCCFWPCTIFRLKCIRNLFSQNQKIKTTKKFVKKYMYTLFRSSALCGTRAIISAS